MDKTPDVDFFFFFAFWLFVTTRKEDIERVAKKHLSRFHTKTNIEAGEETTGHRRRYKERAKWITSQMLMFFPLFFFFLVICHD